MKKLFTYFCFTLALTAPSWASGTKETATAGPDYSRPAELVKLVESQNTSYILIDVRTKEEYDSGYIPTAINIPYDVIAQNLPTEDRNAKIIVYCRSGHRAGIAKETLESLGFTNVTNFGAASDWPKDLVAPETPGAGG